MAGGKLPPRQKMIGMMYLVLTALLAMNVSKEILNAFVTVNEGLEKTKINFAGKNETQYSAFEQSFSENQAKVGPYWEKAQKVRTEADAVVRYIDEIKVEIIAGVEPQYTKESLMGKNEFGQDTILDLRHVQVKDNYLVPTNLLVGSEPSNPHNTPYSAMELIGKLEGFRDNLISVLDENDKDGAIAKSIQGTFVFEEQINPASHKLENWPAYNFYGVPTAATLTLLTKIQTDVRNAESDVIKYLYSSVDAASFKFNKLEAAVISPSNYVIVGDTFRAEVFLAAFDSTQNPVIKIGQSRDTTNNQIVGDTLEVDIKQGKGFLSIPAKSVGDYQYAGVIKIKNPATKEYNPYYFDFDYKVASPSTTISATKMNVFYIGVPNPVDISAAGVAKDQIQASITNGSISKTKDGWEVNVRTPGTATINVAASVEVDGKMERKTMGSMEFRVKKIPTPIAKVAGKVGGAISKGQLGAQLGLLAEMENFEFDVKVLVAEYEFSYVQANGLTKEITEKSYKITPQISGIIKQLRPGSRVTFENIKVKMPDGEIRKLSPIVFKLV